MAAELQPPVLGNNPITNPIPGAPPYAAQNAQFPSTDNPGPTLGPKRQRRPSVRLGDIGDQPATLRTSKSWRLNPHPHPHREPNTNKPSKIRPLTNLVTPSNGNFDYSSAETTATTIAANNNGTTSLRKLPFRSKRPTTSTNSKRVRTNFRIDQAQEQELEQELEQEQPPFHDLEERENGVSNHDFNDYNDDDEDGGGEEGFRDFDPDIDGPGPGPDQVQSPLHSADDVGEQHLDMWHAHNRRSIRATRVSNSQHDLGLESNSRNQGTGLDDGVRNWLIDLGLARYAPVFEIHEVDDEVLPHLTLEDLKDMGINAVGSRRKLYSAIQKLRKGLS